MVTHHSHPFISIHLLSLFHTLEPLLCRGFLYGYKLYICFMQVPCPTSTEILPIPPECNSNYGRVTRAYLIDGDGNRYDLPDITTRTIKTGYIPKQTPVSIGSYKYKSR